MRFARLPIRTRKAKQSGLVLGGESAQAIPLADLRLGRGQSGFPFTITSSLAGTAGNTTGDLVSIDTAGVITAKKFVSTLASSSGVNCFYAGGIGAYSQVGYYVRATNCMKMEDPDFSSYTMTISNDGTGKYNFVSGYTASKLISIDIKNDKLDLSAGAVQVSSLRTAYVQKSANYTLTALDCTVEVTSGSPTISLFASMPIGAIVVISNTGSGAVNVASNGNGNFVPDTSTTVGVAASSTRVFQKSSNSTIITLSYYTFVA